MGQFRPNWAARAISGLPPIATELQTSRQVSNVPIVLKKSFLTDLRHLVNIPDLKYHPAG